MPIYVLFGVKAPSLNAARDEVEKVLHVKLDPREGLHNGGDYYSLGFPRMVLTLRNNIDLDDEEMEFDGLAEPDFPKYPYLLYLDDAQVVPHILADLESAPDLFEKLRTDVA
jgi:hypothetical protein